MIRTVNLTKQYGRMVAVDNVNLGIGPGEIYGFLGPNGAGKTSTIMMLLGITPPTAGVGLVAICQSPIVDNNAGRSIAA